MTDAEKTQVLAEARFLRGHYHFEAKKMWNKVPFIDEKIYVAADPNSTKVPNTEDIWPKIEADFDFAAKNLPAIQAQKGRATQWAAKTYLAKALIFQKKWSAAKTLLEDVLKNSGKKLVANYHDNYRTLGNNNTESIFEVQFSVNDGTNGNNGNAGDNLNWPYSSTAPGRGCCGFYQPSHNLVNAFKTEDGLPMIGTAADGTLDTYNKVDLPNDQGISASTAFTLDKSIPVDPRLDWTVGRRGVNFLDWGPMPGSTWIRDQAYAGPFTGKKWMYYLAEENSTTHSTSRRNVNNNYRLLKLSHVILWLAECEVELGNLAAAEAYVNQIRVRAKTGSVQDPTVNYKVEPYPTGTFASKGADFSRNAVRMEQRLEFAMEGHRFFDLVRWGIAEKVLNKYAVEEAADGKEPSGRTFKKRG
ncbi:MAG: RagB/SusD family nutrient uptake outer membrane protein, partial [Runella zeae]